MIVLMATAALASWTEIRQADGCTFFRGPQVAQGPQRVRVECTWDDVTAESLDAHLSQQDHYAAFIDALRHEEVVATPASLTSPVAGAVRIRQVAGAPFFPERESLVWAWQETQGSKALYRWSSHGAGVPVTNRVVVPENEGFWAVTPTDSGVFAEFELSYDPGGYIPTCVVRRFQQMDLMTTLDTLHALARVDTNPQVAMIDAE